MTTKKYKNTAELLADKIEAIPTLPESSNRIVSLVNKEDTNADDLERAIRTDQALSAQILRFANSRYYGKERKVTTIKQAVKILGFNTLRSLALSHGMDQKYSAPESPNFSREKFWDYSFATGICSEIIAERLGYSSAQKGQVFSAGHLHASGKAILDQYMHREFIRILEYKITNDTTMIEAEEEILDGITHCDIGSTVLDEWNIPSDIVEAVGNYYHPGSTGNETVIIVHLASVLTKTKGYGFSGDQNLQYLNEAKVKELGIDDSTIQNILKNEFPEKYKRFSN